MIPFAQAESEQKLAVRVSESNLGVIPYRAFKERDGRVHMRVVRSLDQTASRYIGRDVKGAIPVRRDAVRLVKGRGLQGQESREDRIHVTGVGADHNFDGFVGQVPPVLKISLLNK